MASNTKKSKAKKMKVEDAEEDPSDKGTEEDAKKKKGLKNKAAAAAGAGDDKDEPSDDSGESEMETDEEDSEDEYQEENNKIKEFMKKRGDKWFDKPKSKCHKCKALVEPKDQEEHLGNCWFIKDGEPNCIHLACQAFQGVMRLDLALPMTADFRMLDVILQNIWMMCCGHMTQFWYKPDCAPMEVPQEYRDECMGVSADLDIDFDDKDKSKTKKYMDTLIKDILKIKDQCVLYCYDMGTTTTCIVKFNGVVKLNGPKLSSSYKLLMRNQLPEIPCFKCEKQAKYVYSYGGLDELSIDQYFCSKRCAKEDLEMLLPFKNSPRSGACGYGATGR